MKTYVFPGQGSQAKGMGGTLFDDFPEITRKADEILDYSIKELCLHDPNKELSQTQFTQPAIYVVNALSYFKALHEDNEKPDFVAGHSLGEYNALLASDVFDFETGLRLVKKRGELMGQVEGGAMCAVLGLRDHEVESILRDNGLDTIDIANYNAPTQIVLSGLRKDIYAADPFFQLPGVRYIPLNTSGAFHSRYMKSVQEEFERFIRKEKFANLAIPVISNRFARPYRQDELIDTLVSQMSHSVKWSETVRYLLGQGDMEFQEIGQGQVLSKLILQIREDAPPPAEAATAQVHEKAAQPSLRPHPAPVTKDAAIEGGMRLPANEEAQVITLDSLGCQEFKRDYNLRYPYVAGGMYRGIASKEMVLQMAKAGMMSYFGAAGLHMEDIDKAIVDIQSQLTDNQPYGFNLINNKYENDTVELFLKRGVRNIEAAAYMEISAALVKYRLTGLSRNRDGSIRISNRIMAKVSRPEVAKQFLSPAPWRIVEKLLNQGVVSPEQAELSKIIPMADDLCVEADSGGHTDQGVSAVLIPAMLTLRDEMTQHHNYQKKIRLGAAGGIGTPEAAAAAFVLGADFILTGSINQCTVEAGASDAVKDLLQEINVQDTEIAPAGDMFELGAKVQVVRKGMFFPARANKLFDLYRNFNSLDEIDEKTRNRLQKQYFKRSFDQIFQEVKEYYPPERIAEIEKNPKQKMAQVFKWYFRYASRLALDGVIDQKVDFQVQCGPAMGAFNQWVKNSDLHHWRQRHVDRIGKKILEGAADILNRRYTAFFSPPAVRPGQTAT